MIVDEPAGLKERQTSKIKELADTLVSAGFVSLDDQAKALGLSRSTTWTILRAQHKNYGLSAALINRILRTPDLNTQVRAKLIEYVREKAAGSYGHNNAQLRRFLQHLGGSTRFLQHLGGSTTISVRDKLFAHANDERNAFDQSIHQKANPSNLSIFKARRI